jgi:hypothetical protein
MSQVSVGDYGTNSPLGPAGERYFYGLRVAEDGTLYFKRVDLWTSTESVEINKPGDVEDDWKYFEIGVDYFDGKNPETHERETPNLNYDQYRFDSKSIFYYINADGELIARVNQSYTYPSDV